MRLVYVFAAILAVSIAETDKKVYDDLEAMETMELKKEIADLTPAASVYNYVPPSHRSSGWNQNYVPNQPSYVPSQTWTPPNNPNQPIYNPPSVPANPPYAPPAPASPPYAPPVQSDYVPPQNHYHPQNTWTTTPQYTWTTPTTPVPVIKNEQSFGDNGSYKYEYQIADGTHVGEEGYYTDPKGTEESLVKKGWYSFKGGDGKVYTVTYWADHTGYHAYGDHLPTPPPVPAAIQAALDKAEAEKNQQPSTYPPQTQKPYYPQYDQPQQVYYPPQQQPQQPYYPPQQPYYPPQSPSVGK